MAVSVRQAAERLRLGEHRVRALIASGVLEAELIGGRYIVDEHSLDAVEAATRPAHIRSFARRVAWAAAMLADGHRPRWLSQPELSRLRKRMDSAGTDPADWQARMRGRAASSLTYRAGSAVLDSVRHDRRLAATGASATNLSSDRRIGSSNVQLWCRSTADRDAVVAAYGLLPTTLGNVELRVAEVPGLSALGENGNAWRVIVAVDLLGNSDARSRSAGRMLLEAALTERRWAHAGE